MPLMKACDQSDGQEVVRIVRKFPTTTGSEMDPRVPKPMPSFLKVIYLDSAYGNDEMHWN